MIQITEKLQKKYLTDYNLLIAQDFWEAHFQIFLIILLKELIKSNVNTNTMTKNVKLMELNINIVTAFLNFSNHHNSKFILLL